MSQVGHLPQAHRFVFDRVFTEKPFNSDADLVGLEAEIAGHPVGPSFSEQELETARELGFEDGCRRGHEEGLREGAEVARQEIAAQAATALAGLKDEIGRIGAQHAEMFESLAHDCERLVGGILDRLLPELVRRGGAEEVLGVVRTSLSIACNDPVVEVRVPHDLLEILRPQIAQLAPSPAFRGRIELLGDSYLTGGMARVRWSHGGAQRDPDQLLAEMSAIIDRTLRGDPMQQDTTAAAPDGAAAQKEGE